MASSSGSSASLGPTDLLHQIPGTRGSYDVNDWRKRAVCRGLDPEMFHPAQGAVVQAQAARAVCRTCPVADECLESALVNGEHIGIWGGTTEKERIRIRRQRRAA